MGVSVAAMPLLAMLSESAAASGEDPRILRTLAVEGRVSVGHESVPRALSPAQGSPRPSAEEWSFAAISGSFVALRSHAYLVRSERYYELEDRLTEILREAPREQILGLLGEGAIVHTIELMSGEWRLLFEVCDAYKPIAGGRRRHARMIVAPDQLNVLVSALWRHELHDRWRPVAYGLSELTLAMPLASGLLGVVILEEDDEWIYQPPVNEISAISGDVFRLLEPHYRRLLAQEDYVGLARMATDHAASTVEFTVARWRRLREHCSEYDPELAAVFDRRLSPPEECDAIIARMGALIDPEEQPSLDSWLRVHASRGQYALYFRDIRVERLIQVSKAS